MCAYFCLFYILTPHFAICALYARYYPPRDEAGVATLYKRLQLFKRQEPLFVDFTWGAGGSTSDLTIELSTKTQTLINTPTNMHLTCTNMVEDKIHNALKVAKEHNVRNIVALRGDPPAGQEKWEVTEGGFACAYVWRLITVLCVRSFTSPIPYLTAITSM